MATISRSEMQAAIAAGGVVLHGGRIYHDPADLPGEAELAQGDPDREKAAAEAIDAQIAALQRVRANIGRTPAPAPARGGPEGANPRPAEAAPAPAAKPAPAPEPKAEKK